MSACVVDASVIAAALFQEPHADRARTLLAGGQELYAPDLIHAEVANVIWKRHRRREVDDQEAGELLTDLLRLPLWTTPSADLAAAALQLALRTRRTVYDCLYVALAVAANSVLVTNDRRLINALAGSPLEDRIAWLGEYG
ncbi:MAG: type II toxin-antitoxin system VapC family toxin [Planctomycetes bacterium]|nr:type II toxin-antitoxin system VapC family toxin [Planctomycetota bacterium]